MISGPPSRLPALFLASGSPPMGVGFGLFAVASEKVFSETFQSAERFSAFHEGAGDLLFIESHQRLLLGGRLDVAEQAIQPVMQGLIN